MVAFFELLACLGVSFIFSGVEAGILSINRVRLRHRAKLGEEAALVLSRLLEAPERMLITVLVVTNLMQILALGIGVQCATRWLGNAGYWVVLAVALPVWVLAVELLPKSLFRRFPYRALATLSWILTAANTILRPFHFLGTALVQKLFLKRSQKRLKLFGRREDFKYLIGELEKTGSLGSQERSIIHSILDFRGLTAMDVLMPLEVAGAVPGDLPLPAARTLARSLGVDRLPVLGEGGRVSGLLDLHDLALQGEWHGPVEIFQRRIVLVELHEPAYAILRKLRAARLPMAVVREASGASVGVVILEDLVRLVLLPRVQAPTKI